MAPMQSKSTSQSTVSPSSLPLASCDCPDRMKEGSILYNLLSSSAHEPIPMDTGSNAAATAAGAAASTPVGSSAASAPPTERRYTTGVTSVSQAVSQALWRRSSNGSNSSSSAALIPPTVIALKHQEVICQQAAQLLLKTVDFVRNSPSCQRLCPDDRITLFQHCWAELLVLMMTQYRFQFETEDVDVDFGLGAGDQPATCHHCHGHTSESMLLRCLVALQGIPTQSDIHMMDCFFSKCELMGLDDKEYAYLKMTILFNPDIPGLVDPAMVEALQSEAQLRLSEYVAAARPLDPLRFARVLLSLPPLRNIRSRVISQLFFHDLIGGVPMEDLLEQMMGVH